MTLKGILSDSVEPIVDTNEEFLSKKGKGKLIKGSTATGTIPTIPSKYFTVVSDNSDKKGFLKSSRRFIYENTDSPGPGSYNTKIVNETFKKDKDLDSISNHKKNNSAQDLKHYANALKNNTPGAGTYNVNDGISKRHDFSRGYSRAFQKPIADLKESSNKNEKSYPAPNQYDVSKSNKLNYRTNNVCADAAFKSQSQRNSQSSNQQGLNPAPGSYNIVDTHMHQSIKTPFSSFKSTTKRITFSPTSLSELPGPADYRPYEHPQEQVTRQLMPRRHYLAISAPAVPISRDHPNPGPGAYNIRSFEDPDKKYMSSAVFVSCTSRWTSETNDNDIPGPTSYSPIKPNKQSFHYNYERKWI